MPGMWSPQPAVISASRDRSTDSWPSRPCCFRPIRAGAGPRFPCSPACFGSPWSSLAGGLSCSYLTQNSIGCTISLPSPSLLPRRRWPSSAIRINHYSPDDPERFATVRLSYPKIAAVAGPCGMWPKDLGPSIDNPGYNENKPYYNFGCATQRNLAAMAENPADLEPPQPASPGHTMHRTHD